MVPVQKRILRTLASLKFAVVILSFLTASLAVATFVESLYDTATARYWVYRSPWFYLLLSVLGVNIIAVMVDRWPWKKRHTPFLVAHVGIILLLVGSWLTFTRGTDGMMRLGEGETSSVVELDQNVLMIQEREGDAPKTWMVNIPWVPKPSLFKAVMASDFGLVVDRWITHADAKIDFRERYVGEKGGAATPAVHVHLSGGPANLSQRLWLWSGDAQWSMMDMGPARFVLVPPDVSERMVPVEQGKALLVLHVSPKGVRYRAVSMRGQEKKGFISASKWTDAVIDTGWMAGTGNPLRIRLETVISDAWNSTQYLPSRNQHGDTAPPSAIHVRKADDTTSEGIWLGLGDRGSLEKDGKLLTLAYAPRRVILPFGVKLDRFKIEHYEGTANPAMYSSIVRVADGGESDPREVSMNEPLDWKGYTFYQASYVPGVPRPTISIFSVNQDPGRWLKYVGSLILVFGCILLFAVKVLRIKKGATS